MNKRLSVIVSILVIVHFISGCNTLPKYPEQPTALQIPSNSTVTMISCFPEEIMFIDRRKGLFDLTQYPYTDTGFDLNVILEKNFHRVFPKYFSNSISENSLSYDDKILLSRHADPRIALKSEELGRMEELKVELNAQYILLVYPTKGSRSTISVGYVPISVDRSLASFTIDPSTIPGPSVKCDAFVMLYDLQNDQIVGLSRVIDNWITIKGVKFKESFVDYSDQEEEIIMNGINLGAEVIWAKSIPSVFKKWRANRN